MDGETKCGRRTSTSPRKQAAAPDYRPAPRDTSGVTIPPDLASLTDVLARNTHENWAAQRLSDGWRWGPSRDDHAREHPCLVAYEELSEEEKEYDRRTALETIRLILALGYTIVRSPRAAGPAPCAGRTPAASPSPSPRACARRTRS